MNKKLTIGLFGFGIVGEGIYDVLRHTPTLNATIKKICINKLKRLCRFHLFVSLHKELIVNLDSHPILS